MAGKHKLFFPYHHLRLPRDFISTDATSAVRMIPLGKGRVAIVDQEDYEKVGDFIYHAHQEKGNIYAIRELSGRKKMRLHWDIVHKPPRGYVIDHRNGDGLDNRRMNLRECKVVRNNQNHKLSSRNKSGYSGVRFDEKRQIWVVTIGINGKSKHLGVFPRNQRQKAIECRRAAEKLYYGEYARTP